MKLSKTAKIFILIYLSISSVFCGISFSIDRNFGFVSLIFFVAVILVAFFREYSFAIRLESISREVERAIHKAERLNLSNYEEGDFSILANQISKMIRIILESEEKLLYDKKILADSIADISHQIRTPLTSINLITAFLANSEIDEKSREENIAKLKIQFKRIDWLVNALLKISKLEAGTADINKAKIKLSHLIDNASESLLVPMELKGIDFSVKSEGMVEVDLMWTSEAITNILKNCMEHTPPGGKITVKACENALYSEITINDSGNGIDKDDLPHIFERFYKGKNSSETSIGIGLSMSRMIISSQGGIVTAANSSDGGAEFNIKFYKSVV